MGEVYRAEDTKLKRQVAIKVLPEKLAHDEDLMARFEREARILASLNHPNVASIYELAETEGRRALVLELVEGPTLFEHMAAAHRSGRYTLSPREALEFALQIAEGLAAAHERAIVHRDLKPANIKLTAEGQIKILDFGLGKSVGPEGSDAGGSDTSGLVTLRRSTEKGMILGTAAYMPPEQARGKNVDKRADIWSFGVVLYELMSGVRAFEGETVTDVLAAVVTRDPDWSALPEDVPKGARHLLKRCLERDPKARLRDIGEARVAIEHLLEHPEVPGDDGVEVAERPSSRRLSWLAASLAAAGIAFFAGLSLRSERPAGPPGIRARLVLPRDVPLFMGMRPSLALSPDGARLVVVTQQEGVLQLTERLLSDEEIVPIRGTEDGSGPFFSPDGRFVGFFAEGKLKKVSVDGGTPVVLADAPVAQGGSFAPDGSVVFAPVHGEGLFRVTADGGRAEPLTTVDYAAGEGGHHWPHVLPKGNAALMTVELTGKPYSEARIELVSLPSGKRRVLFEGGTDARYVEAGYVVYWSGGDLWAVAFDPTRLEMTSAPFPVTRRVMAGKPNGFAQYAVSNDGTFVYIDGVHPLEERYLTFAGRTGETRTLSVEPRSFENPRISPDGRRLVVNVSAADDNLWVYDFERGTLTRLTFEGENRRAVWSPSGDRIAFTSHSGGASQTIRLAPIDGSRPPDTLRTSDAPELPESWSTTDVLAFTRRAPETGSDVWVLPLAEDTDARPFLGSRFEEGEARFSPDGRWLAYQSDESGQPEIYVRAFPGPGGKRQVSVEGGIQPRWRGDGRELYFRSGEAVMAVSVTATDATLDASIPHHLFEAPATEKNFDTSNWDALPDGTGFVFIQEHAEPRYSVRLVTGWFDALAEAAP